MNNSILRNALVTFASFIFVITIVSAWTAPPTGTVAPANNVSAPLTIGATSQSKAGGLDVAWLNSVGSIKVGNTAAVWSAGIAGSLRYNAGVMEHCNGTAWVPFAGGVSTITNGACGVGQVVKSISATGVVTCAAVTSLPGLIVGGCGGGGCWGLSGCPAPSTTRVNMGADDPCGGSDGSCRYISYVCIKN